MKRLLLLLCFIPALVFSQQSRGYNVRPLNVPIGTINKGNVVLVQDVPTYLWHRGASIESCSQSNHSFAMISVGNTLEVSRKVSPAAHDIPRHGSRA